MMQGDRNHRPPHATRRIPACLLALSMVLVSLPSPPALADAPTGTAALSQHTATSGAWTSAGFGGAGNFLGIYFDSNQPGVVYAASDVTGIFRSSDNGNHWEMRSAGLGNYEVSSFAVDPFDSRTLYAGTGAVASSNRTGIYVSHDAGLTWQHLNSTFANRISFRRFRTANAIAPDPAHWGFILSGSRGNGIWRTADSGASWSRVYAAPLTSAPRTDVEDLVPDDPAAVPYPAPVSIVVFDPAAPNTVYAGFDGAGVVRSTNSGVSWQPISSGLPSQAKVKYLAVSSSDDVLYAAVGTAGVYKSDDSGDSWYAVNNGLPTLDESTWVSSVVVHPADSDTAYLTLATFDYANVWKTTNGGTTWSSSGPITDDPLNDPTETWAVGWGGHTLSWQVALDPHQPQRLFYVNFWRILRSDDAGAHWASKIVGAQNTCVTALAVDADRPAGQPDMLYATHMDAGLLASANKGLTWAAVIPSQATGYDVTLAGHFWQFATARVSSTKYYYATSDPWDVNPPYGQVLRSADGLNWTSVFSNARPAGRWMGGAMMGLAVDPASPSTLYVTQDGGQVWKSTARGAPGTWSPTNDQPGDDSFTYALAVDGQHRVFAGTLLGGLWRSTNGGDTWQQVLTEQATIWQVVVASNAVYVSAGDANLYRGISGGNTWQKLTNFSSVDDGDGVGNGGRAITVDPNNPDHILFSRTDTWHSADAGPGIVESTDGGATWQPFNDGLRNLSVSILAFGSDGDLFAGTACGGVWRSPAGSSSVRLPLVLKNATSAPAWWQPPVRASLQLQFTGLPIDQSVEADVYDIDMFDSDASLVTALHAKGRTVLCYINVGAWEDWRSDANQFPSSVLGKDYAGWPGEKWLDIRQINLLAPIMRARFDQCQAKGFDGVEPDNINGYLNDTGFPLTGQHQVAYNTWLANEAHARGLAIGLKNDTEQVNNLLPHFDWVLTESCLAEGWCDEATPFVAVGKPVFAIEYSDTVSPTRFLNQLCPQAAAMNLNAALKRRSLDAWRLACP